MARQEIHTRSSRGFSLRLILIALASIVLILSGCRIQFGDNTPKTFSEITIPAGFTFATAREVTFNLTVSYRVYNHTTKTTEVVPYGKDKIETVSVLALSGDTQQSLGSVEVRNGTGSSKISVPSSVSRLAFVPDRLIMVGAEQNIGPTDTVVDATLAPPAEAATFSSAQQLFSSRVLGPVLVPFGSISGFKMLTSSIDADGRPVGTPEQGGLEDARYAFAESFLTDTGLSFPEYQRVPEVRPSYISDDTLSSIVVDEDAEVAVTFISEGANYKNSLGYFVRPTGAALTAPTPSEIILIFPNSSAKYSGGGLQGGDTIKLRYPIAGTNNGSYVFPAGVTVHFVLLSNAYSNGTVSAYASRYYSVPELNPEYSGSRPDASHAALLYYHDAPYDDIVGDDEDKDDDAKLMLGFEDVRRGKLGENYIGDEDFNDSLFVVTATPFKSVDTAKLPVPNKTKPEDMRIPDTFPAISDGTMIFEDMWPSKGDYDFNDMVVDFRLHTIRDGWGYAIKIDGDFTLHAAGASLNSGLALLVPVNPANIDDVKYTAGPNPVSPMWNAQANGVEYHPASADFPDGYAVVPILDSALGLFNAGTIVNTDPAKAAVPTVKIKFQVDFATDMVRSSTITSRTPDIFLVRTGERQREVHILGKKPTSAAVGYFNTVDDASTSSLYYKDSRGAPWALMVASPFVHVIEQKQLPEAYLKFASWVESNGMQNTNWADSKTSSNVDASLLYTK